VGGCGSGRQPDLGRQVVEDAASIAITPLVRRATRADGRALEVRRWGDRSALVIINLTRELLTATWVGEGETRANLVAQPMPTDARRWLVECPACDRVCRILYVSALAPLLRCRSCADLRYRSQTCDPGDLALHQLGDLRVRLGGPKYRDLRLPTPPRPRGTHHATYERMVREIHRLTRVAFGPKAVDKREQRMARLRRQGERSDELIRDLRSGKLKGQIISLPSPRKKPPKGTR
jgi:hypothetical protein